MRNQLKWGIGLLFVSAIFGVAQDEAQLIVVSKPPPPSVESDPPQGLLFASPFDMASSSPYFDTAGAPESLEYIRFRAGNAYVTFDDGPDADYPGGIMVIADFATRQDGGFDPSQDRLITGANAGLLEPKGIALAPERGVLIVADFAGAKLSIFPLAAEGNAEPAFVVTDLGTDVREEPRRPWGLSYDAAQDRLFVGATDGVVVVFDEFLRTRPSAPTRTIIPTLDDERISSNLHDLSYLPEQDILIVSDVGSATTADQNNFKSDGSVFTLENVSAADGETEIGVYLAGENTLLGNPVGLDFDGEALYVTERTRDLVLRFDDFLNLENPDTAPAAAVTVAQPEDVSLAPE